MNKYFKKLEKQLGHKFDYSESLYQGGNINHNMEDLPRLTNGPKGIYLYHIPLACCGICELYDMTVYDMDLTRELAETILMAYLRFLFDGLFGVVIYSIIKYNKRDECMPEQYILLEEVLDALSGATSIEAANPNSGNTLKVYTINLSELFKAKEVTG